MSTTQIKRLDRPDGTAAMAPYISAKAIYTKMFPTGQLTGIFRLLFMPATLHQNFQDQDTGRSDIEGVGYTGHDNLVIRVNLGNISLLFFFVDAGKMIVPGMIKYDNENQVHTCAVFQGMEFSGGKVSAATMLEIFQKIESSNEYAPYQAELTGI